MGERLNVNVHVTYDMSLKPGSKGEIVLVHGDRNGGYAVMKMDSRAIAILAEGLAQSIQKYASMENADGGDRDKLDKIRELKSQLVYCRDSCIKE